MFRSLALVSAMVLGMAVVGCVDNGTATDSSESDLLWGKKPASSLTVQEAAQQCGTSELKCCNNVSEDGDSENIGGLLGALLDTGGIGVTCAAIPVIGVLPIAQACSAKVACCDGEYVQNGLINLGCTQLNVL